MWPVIAKAKPTNYGKNRAISQLVQPVSVRFDIPPEIGEIYKRQFRIVNSF